MGMLLRTDRDKSRCTPRKILQCTILSNIIIPSKCVLSETSCFLVSIHCIFGNCLFHPPPLEWIQRALSGTRFFSPKSELGLTCALPLF